MSTDILTNYVNGRWVKAEHGGTLPVENPSTGAILGQVPLSTAAGNQPRHRSRGRRLPGLEPHARPRDALLPCSRCSNCCVGTRRTWPDRSPRRMASR